MTDRERSIELAGRLRALREELFGTGGVPKMARRLDIPSQTWSNYEAGVTMPVPILLRLVEAVSVDPIWLLHGQGPKFLPMPLQPAPRASLVRTGDWLPGSRPSPPAGRRDGS